VPLVMLLTALFLVVPRSFTAVDTAEQSPMRAVEPDPDAAARSAIGDGGEAIRMRWRFSGFLGRLASLFVPSSGDALVTSVARPGARREIEFLVTSPKRDGEYLLYGAQIDQTSGSTVKIWSSRMFRGELEQMQKQIDQPQVIDYASVIHHLRWSAPEQATKMTIWSDGDSYAAEVVPLKTQTRKVAGERVAVRGYVVRGDEADGKDSFDDKFYIYFARDERSTPVEIVGKRGWIGVKMQLVSVEGAAPVAP